MYAINEATQSLNIQPAAQLRNYRFVLVYRWGGMIRKLCGDAYNRVGFADGELVYLSRIVEYDETNKIVTTRTGHLYQLINCAAHSEEEVTNEILALVERGSYEILT